MIALALSALVCGLGCRSEDPVPTTPSPPLQPAEVTAEGKHVTVTAPLNARSLAERCRDTLEAAISVYESHLPCRLPPGERLKFHIYSARKSYEDAVRVLWGITSVPLGITLTGTMDSHCLVVPRCDAAFLELVGGLPELTRLVLIHEGVHQWLLRSGCRLGEWPDWYREGIADYVADCCLRTGGKKRTPLHFGDAVAHVREEVEAGDALSLEKLLRANFKDQADRSRLFAYAYSLCSFLAHDTARFEKFHRAMALMKIADEETNTRSAASRACQDLLTGIYGPLDALEKRFRDWAKLQATQWVENDLTSEIVGSEVVTAALLDQDRQCTLMFYDHAVGDSFSLTGDLNILGVGIGTAAIFLGYGRRGEQRVVELGIDRYGRCSLNVFDDGAWQDELQLIGLKKSQMPPCGEWIPFDVRANKGVLELKVGGETVLRTPVPEKFDIGHGRWGIGAGVNCVVRFRNLVVNGTKVVLEEVQKEEARSGGNQKGPEPHDK